MSLEKAMATHSSTLSWKIPWMEEPGRLQSMGSLRVGHNWVTSLSLFTFMCWRRKWQPTPVFLPGESQGRGSLVGCRLWDCRVGHDWCDLAAAAAIMSSMVAISIYIPTSSARGLPFLTPSLAFVVCGFSDGHSAQCEVVSHCSFGLHFSNNKQCWASLHVFISHL